MVKLISDLIMGLFYFGIVLFIGLIIFDLCVLGTIIYRDYKISHRKE